MAPLALLQWVADPVLINQLIIPIAGMLTGIVLGLPVIRAVVRYVERKGAGGDAVLREELDELRHRVEVMEEVRHRMLELEERVDFAERLLTEARERPPIAPGS